MAFDKPSEMLKGIRKLLCFYDFLIDIYSSYYYQS